jgi:hypothetical protein
MNLERLKALLESGQFHHATYRQLGTIWEGFYIYEKAPDPKWVGYCLVGSFNKSEGDLMLAAEDMVRHTGVSLGAYGRG